MTLSRPWPKGVRRRRRDLVRREASLRRELIDDLLRGDSDSVPSSSAPSRSGSTSPGFRQVALAAPSRRLPDADTAVSALEAVMFDRLGDRDVLVATKDGLLVVLAPADATAAGRVSTGMAASNELRQLMHVSSAACPADAPGGSPSAGRIRAGTASPAGMRRPGEAPTMVGRLQVDTPVVNAYDLLVFRVVLRDQSAIVGLVHAVLSALAQARGAGPLLSYPRDWRGGHGETAAPHEFAPSPTAWIGSTR